MPLYIGDYLSNTGRLNTEQHGAYLLLIMDYWVNGRFPDDDKLLSQITRMPTEKWQSIRDVISKYFALENSEWIHERIEKEKGKAEYLSRVRAEAGSKGGSKTQAKHKAKEEQTDKPGLTPSQSPSQSPLESSSQTESQTKKDKPVFVLPDWVDTDLWIEWMDIRKKKKAVNSKRAKEALVEKLFIISQSGISVNMAIKTAIERSWKSVELDWLATTTGKKKDGYTEFLERHDAAN
jgi:uncharacterized protein YdaU (DUF1376 family)